jgi:sulfate transport system ATP-binding protein
VLGHDGVLGSVAAEVTRLVRVGFEVRLTVRPEGAKDAGDEVAVTLTRSTSRHLGLDVGSKVWLVPNRGARTVPVMAAAAAV